MNDTLTAVPGLRVGHATDPEAATGCTVVLTPQGARGAVSVRGLAPGSRELMLLDPARTVDVVHAVLLTGGSAFGLAAADGVVRWLEERGHGFEAGVARVPIVPAAVLFDLSVGSSRVRPWAADGYAACEQASAEPVAQGNVGAGTGCSAGKLLGASRATKVGLGSASVVLPSGATVGALVAANPFGDVVDPDSGQILAGARAAEGNGWAGTEELLVSHAGPGAGPPIGNTTLGLVATDAGLTKAELHALADMAHDGFARAIRPVHTVWDGDTLFALSTGDRPENLLAVGAAAVRAVAAAVVRAVRHARSLHGMPSGEEAERGFH